MQIQMELILSVDTKFTSFDHIFSVAPWRFTVDASSCLQNGLLQIEVNAVALTRVTTSCGASIQGWTWQPPSCE